MLDYHTPVILGTPNVEEIPRILAKFAHKFEWQSIINIGAFRLNKGRMKEHIVYYIRIEGTDKLGLLCHLLPWQHCSYIQPRCL
ncbi:hypothetical protein F4680DRAFT_425878 [Xylaria scruposa]|nr:hypothetical protein F4680DRAFT_425878 [Xylaria scruposa]